ncbi:hypothetical protein H4R33_006461 [Dimargaris cristalligena]|nr:hypothetical protein H4R33_006461 [Dimargaris cristalligena]
MFRQGLSTTLRSHAAIRSFSTRSAVLAQQSHLACPRAVSTSGPSSISATSNRALAGAWLSSTRVRQLTSDAKDTPTTTTTTTTTTNAPSSATPAENETTPAAASSAPAEAAATPTSAPEPTEKEVGTPEAHEFRAETRQLLDIVAHSLYSEREVFVRELVSNAADALEKLRHMQLVNTNAAADQPLEIAIGTDTAANTITITDSGIGMTHAELVQNLGTIAHSGSKDFMKQLETAAKTDDKKTDTSSVASAAKDRIIGQFGVGFYSAFMVGDKLTVYTRSSSSPDAKGYCWKSDGLGSYSISEAEGVAPGTKIVIHLRDNSTEFAKPATIRQIVTKYSNFINFPVKLNGEQVNTVSALWKKSKNSVTEQEHLDFFHFLAGSKLDQYRYNLHYSTDAPLSIQSVLYIPKTNAEATDMSGQLKPGVNLYSRTVLIQANSDKILPPWLRFIRGAVDSEDIPLNLSRELLQDGALIRRLRDTLTNRIIKWLQSESKANPDEYLNFLKSFSYFLKEGALQDSNNSDRIANLLRFPTSSKPVDEFTSFSEYIGRMVPKQKAIFYLNASNRRTAEENPYLETFKRRNVEVLYLYEDFDSIVFSQLGFVSGKPLVSIDSAEAETMLQEIPLPEESADKDNAAAKSSADTDVKDSSAKSDSTPANGSAEGNAGTPAVAPRLTESEIGDLKTWLLETLGIDRVKEIKVSTRLVSHPAVVLNHQNKAFRQIMTAMRSRGGLEVFPEMPDVVSLEINPQHPVIYGLYQLMEDNPTLASDMAFQVLDNAMLSAGAMTDPLTMLPRLNRILQSTVEAATKTKKAAKAESTDPSPSIPVVEGEKVTDH